MSLVLIPYGHRGTAEKEAKFGDLPLRIYGPHYMTYTTIVTYKGILSEFSIGNNDYGSTLIVILMIK